MTSLVLFLILTVIITVSYAQMYGSYNPRPKLGSCAPPLAVDVCSRSCYWDNQCLGIEKCCPTSCGGSVCSRPVTTRNPATIGTIKAGVCPQTSNERWICSSTCIDDSDCPEKKKCCKTRCGGNICKKPHITEGEEVEKDTVNNDIDIYSNSISFDNGNNNNNNNFDVAFRANRNNPFLFRRSR
ncbi:WAP four-disulfide core domain protein 2-like [Leptopilina heterotoma]|uniref:WAP four-disulfide core domain protein 2-like n=1 Tax=Leptopilina heterotoma TaxID=63436 RepID=UPI001CA83CE3|nr:WAP four-disulfide core domain protein 2-like [Leptopilina heterotoma]XP_043482565.1 WAP four-disulfide core domain protein 2-like [Leptopilina heterotoma]